MLSSMSISAASTEREPEKSGFRRLKLVLLIMALAGIFVTLGVAATGANGASSNEVVGLKQEAAVPKEHELMEGDGGGSKHFSYSGKTGPSHWEEISEACGGKRQSPINVATRAARGRGSVATFFYDQGGVTEMQHNPHTVDVLLPQQNDYVMVQGTRYDFAQFHFHHPSEHTIDGRHADAEVHFVHVNQKLGKYVVFALMCYVPRQHHGENVLLKRVITESDVFPLVNGQNSRTNLGGMNILRRVGINNGHDEGAFEYQGSLTTPPCTETVTWLIRRKSAYISQKALETLKRSFEVNNRPVQALNGRVVQYGKLLDGRQQHHGHHGGHGGHGHHGHGHH